MSHQVIASTFRSHVPTPDQIPCNVQDVGASTSTWTGGGTIIEQIAIQPPLTGVWSIIGWSVSLEGFVHLPFTTAAPFGKLGKIIGGITHGTPTPTQVSHFNIPWVNPMIPLPNDTAGLSTIWDGATDPCFPLSSYPNNPISTTVLSPMTVEVSLPVPLDLQSEPNIQFGLWITPSLAQNAMVCVANASYAIIYDDNQPATPGWGQ